MIHSTFTMLLFYGSVNVYIILCIKFHSSPVFQDDTVFFVDLLVLSQCSCNVKPVYKFKGFSGFACTSTEGLNKLILSMLSLMSKSFSFFH